MLKQRAGLGAIILAAAMSAVWGAVSAVPAAAVTSSITNYHYDLAHTGNDPSEPSMTGLSADWSSATLDGRVYGEPLVLNNTVYVATQQNTVYALDAGSGTTIWSLALSGSPYNLHSVPRSHVDSAASIGSGCGNIDPLGITGTPVIDPSLGSAGTLFAVAETWDGSTDSTIEHQLVAVDLAAHTATHVNIDPVGVGFDTGAKRALEQERAALSLAGGKVVVPYGGLAGDCGGYHGFGVSVAENLVGTPGTFEVNAPGPAPNANNRAGGIWGAGGPAEDGSGNVYMATGNGFEDSNSTYRYTDGIIKLNSSMVLQDYFGPTVWRTDDGGDKDLGSQGPLLVPRQVGNPMVFTVGKQQIGYLLDTGALSSNVSHIGGELFSATLCDQESFGASAFLGTNATAGYLYVPCREGLRALTVNTSTPSFARAWIGPSDASGPPIVAGGLVWVHGSSQLYGLDPTTGATVADLVGVDTAYNFSTPSTSGGALFYVGNNVVRAFNVAAPQAVGHITTATEQNGTRDIFQRHAGGLIERAHQTTPGSDAAWSAWAAMGTQQMNTDATVVADADGRLEAFAGGADGKLYRAAQASINSAFGAWTALDGLVIGQPAAGRNADGTLEVVDLGVDHAAYSWRQTSAGNWTTTAYQALGGILHSDLTVGKEADGRLAVFGLGQDSAFWTRVQPSASSSSWNAWSGLGGLGPNGGIVGVGSEADGRLQVFVRGVDNAVWSRVENAPNGSLNGWQSFGGITLSDVDVSADNDGRMQITIRGNDNAIWSQVQSGANGSWLGWQSMGGLTVHDPVAGLDGVAGTLDVFVIGLDNAIWQNYQNSPNGSFHGWISLGGGPAT